MFEVLKAADGLKAISDKKGAGIGLTLCTIISSKKQWIMMKMTKMTILKEELAKAKKEATSTKPETSEKPLP